MAWHGRGGVVLLAEPRADGLQGAVSAAPAVVVCPILHIVVVEIVSRDGIAVADRVCLQVFVNVQRTVHVQFSDLLLFLVGHPENGTGLANMCEWTIWENSVVQERGNSIQKLI